jgi:hypothetical protein
MISDKCFGRRVSFKNRLPGRETRYEVNGTLICITTETDDMGTVPIAVVELDDGSVENVYTENIKFHFPLANSVAQKGDLQ